MEPCIRCAKCVSACALSLEPYLLMTLSEKGLFERAEKERITDCMECGSCSYTCPASRPLLDYIRLGKSTVIKMARERVSKEISIIYPYMSNLLNVSPSPHAHGQETSRKLMLGVIIALIPALFTSIFYFGYGAIIVTATSIISCVLFEYLIQRFIFKKPITITDGSAVVTGFFWHSTSLQTYQYS